MPKLNYTAKKPESNRGRPPIWKKLIEEFDASGKSEARVELEGTSPRTAYQGLNQALRNDEDKGGKLRKRVRVEQITIDKDTPPQVWLVRR
jgi:hypothetical protein